MAFAASLLLVPRRRPRTSRAAPSHTPSHARGARMCESSGSSSAVPIHPALARHRIVALGACCVDMVATVSSFPEPDSKVRSTAAVECGGGNASNAATAARRLGVPTRLLTQVGSDTHGASALAELARDGVDTGHVVTADGGRTSFSYVLVDTSCSTRTVIHTPGAEDAELPLAAWAGSPDALEAVLSGASVLVLDGRHGAAAVAVARAAVDRGVPVVLDVEREREHLDELLGLADYVVASAKYPLAAHPGAAGFEDALALILAAGRARWVVATRGEKGAVLVAREGELGRGKRDSELVVTRRGVSGMRGFEVLECPAWPVEEVVDTTGAGDAFVGAVAYALAVGLGVDAMLGLAVRVAARKLCKQGARGGLPRRDELDGSLLMPLPKF